LICFTGKRRHWQKQPTAGTAEFELNQLDIYQPCIAITNSRIKITYNKKKP